MLLRSPMTALALTPFIVCLLGSSAAACTFFSIPQRYNTQTVDGVVVIGAQRNHPYQVVVTETDAASLQDIQACILDAFLTTSRFGPYIQVASFESRSDAEGLRKILRGEGYSARVVYQRS